MGDGSDPLGKQALFRSPTAEPAASGGRASGRHALYSSSATAAGRRGRDPAPTGGPDPSTHRHPAGPLTVTCSTCGSVERIGVVEFLVLQFPFGAWLPGRTFDRWMTCPACRRRTWTSVTFSR